jgi:hypothetical protein
MAGCPSAGQSSLGWSALVAGCCERVWEAPQLVGAPESASPPDWCANRAALRSAPPGQVACGRCFWLLPARHYNGPLSSLKSHSLGPGARAGSVVGCGRWPGEGGERGATAVIGQPYSINSSARSRSDSGMVSPIASAALRLMTSSNLVGNSTGSSLTLVPRRMRSTKYAVRRKLSSVFDP